MKTTTMQTLCITLSFSDIYKMLSLYLGCEAERARVVVDGTQPEIKVYMEHQVPTPKLAAVVLEQWDSTKKIATIKAVRELLSLGLKEAKDLVESSPCVIVQGISVETAEAVKASLENTGAMVTVNEWKL